jgi:hypothetical protein
VFIDYKAATHLNDHEFIPIRFVRLLNVSSKEPATKYLDTTRVYVHVELEEFVFVSPFASSEISSIPGRPTAHTGDPSKKRDYFYFLEGPEKFSEHNELSQQDTLDHTIQRVAGASSLSNCVFLSAGNVRPFREGQPTCGLASTFQASSAAVIGAEPVYLLDVKPPGWMLPAFIVLIFFGVLLTSTSPEFFKEFEGLCFPQAGP